MYKHKHPRNLEKQSKSREGMRLGKSPEMKKLENNPARPGQTLR